MGTRAVIIFGRTRIATHWDGGVDWLGKELQELRNPTLEQVVKVASAHCIDFATKEVRDLTNMERFEQIAKKTNGKYTAQKLKDMYEKEHKMITFGVQTANDYPIGEFRGYSDFAEYEYNVTANGVKWRKLSGEYAKRDKTAKWTPMQPFLTN